MWDFELSCFIMFLCQRVYTVLVAKPAAVQHLNLMAVVAGTSNGWDLSETVSIGVSLPSLANFKEGQEVLEIDI